MARSLDCNVILKYCEILDEFIKVRVFSDEDLGELLRVKDISNKRAYQQLVVTACVVEYLDTVLPLFKKINRVYKTEALEELLYQICVEVNPHLEIHQVALPVGERGQSTGQLHLLQSPGLGNQKESRRSLDRVEQDLCEQIIGQSEAVATVMRSLRKAAAGLKPPHKPIGVFLLVGQTGTGKTELAKATARQVFGDASRLVRIDCSEYALPHEYAKLIGAPPGYVGHNDGGHLTEAMKERRNGVVLFDEVEKAHRKVHNLLLQIMDEGFVTDSKGQAISFQQSIILLTSNLGVEELDRIRNRMGLKVQRDRDVPVLDREEAKDATLEAMRNTFRPEFINRLDGVVVFNALSERDCVRIARNQLQQVAGYLKESGIELEVTPRVHREIATLGFHPEYGARELRRTIQTQIEEPLSERILCGDFEPGSSVRISVRSGRFQFECRHPSAESNRPRRSARSTERAPCTVPGGEAP